MIHEIETLILSLDQKLEEVNTIQDPIARLDESIRQTLSSLNEVRQYVAGSPFKDSQEEIVYFKRLSPPLFSKYFYFCKVHELEILKKANSTEKIASEIQFQMEEIEHFFARNLDFFRYYYSGSTAMDLILYSRNDNSFWPFENISPIIDPGFSIASFKISWLLAYDRFRCYLSRESKRLLDPSIADTSDIGDLPSVRYEFKGSKSYLAEAIVCLNESGLILIDGKKASLTQLVRIISKLFEIDLEDFSHLDYANRLRKKDMTPLMHLFVKLFTERSTRLNK